MTARLLKVGLVMLLLSTVGMVIATPFIEGWTMLGTLTASAKGVVVLVVATIIAYLVTTVGRAIIEEYKNDA
jgi:hypothetical protein